MYLDEIVDLRRMELEAFFRRLFGRDWRRLVAVRIGVHYRSVVHYWPRRECPQATVFGLEPYERFARSLGFVSPLDRPHDTRREYLTTLLGISKIQSPTKSIDIALANELQIVCKKKKPATVPLYDDTHTLQ